VEEEMKKFNGISSLLFFAVSILIGLYILWGNNINLAILYIILLIAAAVVIPYVYCTKCPCRKTNCAHVLPGLITRFMPDRDSEDYTVFDWAVVLIFMGLLIVLPQFWLYENILLFSVFWILSIVAGVQILLFVCKTCDNKKCILCRQR
jgi:hypothetical protein